MEYDRKTIRNILFVSNGLLLMLCFTLAILLFYNGVSSIYMVMLPIVILLIEAVVFLVTFKYLTLKTRKTITKFLSVYVLLAFLITIAYFMYEKITGYVYIYKYTYGFLLVSFLIYPTILLVMLMLLNHTKQTKHTLVVAITSILVVCLMFGHGVFGSLGSKQIRKTEDHIYVIDSLWLHGTEYEYRRVNEYFMEYVGISYEW